MAMPRPTHRVVYERATGRIVGQPAPIAQRDWPFSNIPFSEMLWRYMDFWKFEDMTKSASLFLSRADKFNDPFERRLMPANKDAMSESDKAFRALYKINDTYDDAQRRNELNRRCVFISCWQKWTPNFGQ
jgi:hypothetical protein